MRGTLAVAADPLAGLTIDSVVAAANTSKPRVYRYFPSADAAFSRVLAEILMDQEKLSCELIRGPGSPDERFARLASLLANPTNEQRTVFRLELLAIQQSPGDAQLGAQLCRFDAALTAALTELFEAADAARGLLSGYTARDAAASLCQLRRGCLSAMLSAGWSDDALAATIDRFWRSVTRLPASG